MKQEKDFEVNHYSFTSNLLDEFGNNHYAQDLWPIVYILSDGKVKQAYVGETTDAFSRLSTHLKNDQKSKLSSVHLITSDRFNKSATLDIESNLIKYMSGDGQYQLLNGNLGLANHNYFQKREIYWEIFNAIWDNLRAEGIVKHSVEHIDNSDLFKYSPYKSLTREQVSGLLGIINGILDEKNECMIVEGGAGTGKSILAIFLFKMLSSKFEDLNYQEFGEDEVEFIQKVKLLKEKFPSPKMALVVPMSSFRNTLKKVFKNIKGLSGSMVIGPAEVTKNEYDLIVVDESHRLRRRVNLGAYFGAFDKANAALGLQKMKGNELDWMLMQSKKTVLFYDEGQSIKPSDVLKEDFERLKTKNSTQIQKLKSQFRVRGGNAYVDFVHKLLDVNIDSSTPPYRSKDYELILFNYIEEMVDRIKKRDEENGLARMIAGYSWPWISKNNEEAYDIELEGIKLKWNNTSNDWINSEKAVDEVGCIHTVQGYDLNYAGVIFGHEISYDKTKKEIVILEDNYFDRNGKQSIKNPEELKDFILNIYKTIMLRGIRGAYVYVCDKNLREYMSQYIPQYIPSITKEAKTVPFKFDQVKPFENSVPLYDLKVAAGEFGEMQQPSDVSWIKVPEKYKNHNELFACQVVGNSMNRVIPDRAYCLFRKYSGGSRNGMIVLVEHSSIHDSDYGSCYTVKEYQSKKKEVNDTWTHESIILKPLSWDSSYRDIILEEDDLSILNVIGVFECVL